MCCLFLAEHWFSAQRFHPMKGTPNWFSFEENPDLAGEFLLFHIREVQPKASAYNQGK